MKVVYYGRDLYHADERAGHKYIARIPFGDKFRYFYDQAELAAYKAGKAGLEAGKAAGRAIGDMSRNASSAIDQMGKAAGNAAYTAKYAVKNAVNEATRPARTALYGIKRNAQLKKMENAEPSDFNKKVNKSDTNRLWSKVQNEMNKRRVIQNRDIAKSKGAKYDRRVDADNNDYVDIKSANGSSYKRTYSGDAAVAQARSEKTKGKNNSPKYNQGIASTVGRHNTPKDNQGIDSSAGSRYMDSLKAVSDKPSSKGSTSSSGKKYVEPTGKGNSPKDNQGINSKDRTGKDNSSIHTSNHGIDSQKKARDEKNWKKATDDLKNSVKKDTTNLMAGAETAAANKSAVSAKKKATEEKKAAKSDSARLKSLTKSFEQRYIADGHDPADAKKWAKNAAENYIKKHPTK